MEVKFTCEVEENGVLPFLDLLLKRKPDGTIDVSVYRKPTATNRFITSESNCPSSHKMAALHSIIYRSIRSIASFMAELGKIKEIASTNGYALSIVENMVYKH